MDEHTGGAPIVSGIVNVYRRPTLSTIEPERNFVGATKTITLSGSDFKATSAMTCRFDSIHVTQAYYVSETKIICLHTTTHRARNSHSRCQSQRRRLHRHEPRQPSKRHLRSSLLLPAEVRPGGTQVIVRGSSACVESMKCRFQSTVFATVVQSVASVWISDQQLN